ncbi:Uncharacterised protein [Metamycoplasma alkalescens]|uniref:Uncharacterized protein n=1 Tax=Metamycoplasma alkalescens TaxID=45363 RepID=A0A3B0NZY5_9BACT|nr:Uncharacterised protein [Metamycoplasma alkalescens]
MFGIFSVDSITNFPSIPIECIPNAKTATKSFESFESIKNNEASVKAGIARITMIINLKGYEKCFVIFFAAKIPKIKAKNNPTIAEEIATKSACNPSGITLVFAACQLPPNKLQSGLNNFLIPSLNCEIFVSLPIDHSIWVNDANNNEATKTIINILNK